MTTNNSRGLANVVTAAPAADFAIDASHTVVEFAVKHMMFSTVKGRFTEVEGIIHLDREDPTRSWVDARVRTDSVDTRDEKRDAHLRSADFFDAANYPEITFRSKRVELAGQPEEARVVGDLTIRGITREVAFAARFLGSGKNPWGKTVAGLSAMTTINRKDFGLTWNVGLEAGGFLVGDEIQINLEIEAIQSEA